MRHVCRPMLLSEGFSINNGGHSFSVGNWVMEGESPPFAAFMPNGNERLVMAHSVLAL
jgi:hypothetical protein